MEISSIWKMLQVLRIFKFPKVRKNYSNLTQKKTIKSILRKLKLGAIKKVAKVASL